MKVNTYLNFPVTCAEALDFYAKHLGAKILMKGTFAGMPADGAPKNLPPGLKPEWILHARFQIGDTVLMASDGPTERAQTTRSVYVSLRVDSDEEAERIYAALTESGEVFMRMSEQFFAYRFGQFRDKFGVNWMVIHEKPMAPRS